MGQRLVIEFSDKKRRILNCYYQWSGYTVSAVEELEAFFEGYRNVTGKTGGVYDERLRVIRSLMYVSPERRKLNRKIEECGDENQKKFYTDYGSRFSKEDVPFARLEYPGVRFPSQKKANGSRGLISISDTEMRNAEFAAEAILTVRLDKADFGFDMFWEFPNYQEYVKERRDSGMADGDAVPESDIPEYPYGDFVKFSEFDDFRRLVTENETGLLRRPDGRILVYL